MLSRYKSAKLTNLTAISRIFYVTLVFIHTPSDVHMQSPSPLNHVAISKEKDENQGDSDISEMAARFVSLADS